MLLEFDKHEFNLPDFFIIGAPKCGTTALTNYLRQHPKIFIPSRKELHHFANDLYDPSRRQFKKDFYYNFFKDASSQQIVGDASVFHLYSKIAHKNILEFNPDAKIIVMLRNPADMLYSYHSQLVFNGDEDIMDFEHALELEEVRKKGNKIPKNVKFHSMLYYSDVVDYATQLSRYLNAFDNDKLMVILFDDFKSDTRSVYQKTLDFLGVENNVEPDFRIINPNKVTRYGMLRKIYGKKPDFIENAGKILLPSKNLRKKLLRRIKSFNTVKVEREKLDPALRESLKKKFKPKVVELEYLIDRDLSTWYN